MRRPHTFWRRTARAVASTVASPLLIGFMFPWAANTQAQTWNGSGTSDLWGTATNWTPNTVPNSSTADVTVTNATNNPVLIDISPTIANLTLGSTNSVTLDNGNDLTVAGGTSAGALDIAGTLTLGSSGSDTDLILGGTTSSIITLSGGGILSLSNNSANRIYSTTGDTLVNSASNDIEGSGQFGINNSSYAFTLNNAGIIDANQTTALQVAPTDTVTNTGTLEATAGGTLDLIATFTNTGGTILSTGTSSLVDLAGSTITGGTLTTTSAGTLQNSGIATLNGTTISTGSTVTLTNGSSTTLMGTTTINGTIAQNSTGSDTDLIVSGAVTLTSSGALTLSNNFGNRIYGSGSDSLTNDTTIKGAGQIGINNTSYAFMLDNTGTIDANQSTALQVAPTDTVTNTGTLEATAGGTLDLIATFTNTGGTILSTGASSLVDLAGSTITGGTLTTTSGGTLQNSDTATLNGLTISTGSTVTLGNGSSTTLVGTITNTGTLLENSTGSDTDLHVSGTVTLTSSGDLKMSNNFANRIYGSGSDSLTNDTNHTIEGAGEIGINNTSYAFTLDNKGTIDANQTAALQVAPTNTVTNTGTLEATAGGTLDLIATVTNTGGTILSTGASSLVDFAGSTITGGTLTTTSAGTLQNSGTATLSGTTVSTGSTVTLTNDSSATLLGTITNTGTIAQNSTGADTDLLVSGTVTLTSSGALSLSNNFANRIYGSGSDSLTNDTNHTIEGAGQIGINNTSYAFTLDNKGIIDANVSSALQVAPTNTVTNTGTLEATAGGTLNLLGGTFNNTGGTILSTGTGSTVNVANSTIAGGTLTTTSSGSIQNNGSATFDGTTNSPTISTSSTVTLDNGSTTILMGTITNNGTLQESSTGSDTDIQLNGSINLTGSGALSMSNIAANRIYGVNGGTDSLTNGASHTIEGSGQLGINDSSYAFTLTNNGTILANQDTTLSIAPTNAVTNNGIFQANSGNTLFMNGTLTNYAPGTSTLTGGTYNAYSGTIELSQANGTNQVIATNAATILLDGAPALIADGSGVNILQGFLSTNASAGNFTIQNGANLTSASSLFTNNGTMTVGANSTFTVGGSDSYQNNGTLEGDGTIVATTLSNSATVHPGHSPGILGVVGNYHQDSAGTLDIQIGGAGAGTGYSQLEISAMASVAGTLDLSLINGFTPSNGEKFVILISGGLSGFFATVNGMDEGNTDFSVAYGPGGFTNDVVLTAAIVPEPTSVVLVGLSLLGMGLRGMRPRGA